mmetsp:Transcript_2807/g.7195  ORF Transcript_2807/g.7195 Transcript_2807/m.7195 type:complete len:199 (-) Transcript_2807:5-601(-)
MSIRRRPLFGGAMACQIPEGWLDVSDMRQVPDHQECWTSSETGALLVIEILEYQSAVSNEAAAEYFYKDLAESNGIVSTSNDLQLTSLSPPTAGRSILVSSDESWGDAIVCRGTGYQKIAQGKEVDALGNPRALPEASWVTVHLACIRLPHVTTDLLVTVSWPQQTNPQQGSENGSSSVLFQSVLASLQIHDWSLFGG